MFSPSLALGLLKIQLEIQLDDSLCYWSKHRLASDWLLNSSFTLAC